jgi:hypothetical protein
MDEESRRGKWKDEEEEEGVRFHRLAYRTPPRRSPRFSERICFGTLSIGCVVL